MKSWDRKIGFEALDSTSELIGFDDGFASNYNGRPLVGNPLGKKPLIAPKDWLSLFIVAVLSGVALVVVLVKGISYRLGVINQLVVLGLLFSVMATFTTRQAQLFILICEARYGNSRLQNYQVVLLNDKFSTDKFVTWPVRLALLVLWALPLGLSVAYKKFDGGSTTVPDTSAGGLYGFTGPPGTQRLGLGLSLMANSTVPYIADPGIGRTYGFNMFTISNTSTAFLDGPLPGYVNSIQQKLQTGESRQICATVNATISTYTPNNPPPSQILDPNFGSDAVTLPIYPGNFSFLIPDPKKLNYTQLYVSVWDAHTPITPSSQTNTARNQTFGSQAIGVSTERRLCEGSWSISLSSVNLVSATCNQTRNTDQCLVENVYIAADADFLPSLAEYISPKGAKKNAHPSPSLAATVVGAMMWARTTSLIGYENYESDPDSGDNDRKRGSWYFVSDEMTATRATLRPDYGLIGIILTNMILTGLLVIGKATFYSTPITNGFGHIALLAGLSNRSYGVLNGAAVSGELTKPIRVQIVTEDRDESQAQVLHKGVESVIYMLDARGRHAKMQKGKEYM